MPTRRDFDLFDQNGYDLTPIEQKYAWANRTGVFRHREHRTAIKSDWFVQPETVVGPVLNHSCLFERKGYSGDAREELLEWSESMPLCHMLLSLRPKWGLDFSMDYVDLEGNVFEILHWEWDSFNYDEIMAVKRSVEPILSNIDWKDAGKQLLATKDQWHHLGFFEQSDWKCRYFGLQPERFKMVAWA